MITFLDGKLVSALPTQATVDVNGVGYEVFIPLSSYDKLPGVGQPIRILTHLVVREDAHMLYGFMTAPERDLFRLLVNNVSGIGPKLALAVLSGMSVTNFKTAVVNSDQRTGQKNRRANRSRVERQTWRRRGMGSGHSCPRSNARAGTGQRSGTGSDRPRLQASRRA
jgi:Holliday junction DNA helicase RuvA